MLVWPAERNDEGQWPWTPNGTLFGLEGDCQDSTGVPIDGLWTANITDRDRKVQERARQIEKLHITVEENPHRHAVHTVYVDKSKGALSALYDTNIGGAKGKRGVDDELDYGSLTDEQIERVTRAIAEDEHLKKLMQEAHEETMEQFAALMA